MIRAAIIPFVLSIAAMLVVWLICGQTLGLYIGGLIVAVILVPPLTLVEDALWRRVFAAGAVADGIGIVWIAGLFQDETRSLPWIGCYCVMLATIALLSGMAAALARCMHAVVASAISIILACAWLTWPVWLSSALTNHISLAGWLVKLHPLFAINGMLQHLGIWTEESIAYGLTSLGQDVPYALPDSVMPCVLLHALGGVGLWMLAHLRRPSGALSPADR